MGKINLGRVILGGLVAGLIINISETILNVPVLGAQLEASLRSMNLPPVGGPQIAVFVVEAFALGIATVWLYASIRPRYGAGAGTGVCAGLFVWFFAYLYPGIANGVLGIGSWKLITIGLIWGLVEIVIASVVGAWLYKE